jgi:hypothetical protein
VAWPSGDKGGGSSCLSLGSWPSLAGSCGGRGGGEAGWSESERVRGVGPPDARSQAGRATRLDARRQGGRCSLGGSPGFSRRGRVQRSAGRLACPSPASDLLRQRKEPHLAAYARDRPASTGASSPPAAGKVPGGYLHPYRQGLASADATPSGRPSQSSWSSRPAVDPLPHPARLEPSRPWITNRRPSLLQKRR